MVTRFVKARFTGVAMALHWLTLILVVANLTLGVSMVPLPLSPRKLQWYMWHKWIGITVFLVTCARLGWRARFIRSAGRRMRGYGRLSRC